MQMKSKKTIIFQDKEYGGVQFSGFLIHEIKNTRKEEPNTPCSAWGTSLVNAEVHLVHNLPNNDMLQ